MQFGGRLGLLGRNARFRVLFAARTMSVLGDFVARVALALYVLRLTGSSASVGLFFFTIAVARLASPLAGTLVDRVDQRRLMVGCDLGQAAVYIVIAALLPPFALLLPLVFAAEILATFFGPAGRTAIPALVDDDDLPVANALLGLGATTSVTLGALVGGLLVAVAGPRAALGADAASFVVSALLLMRLPSLPAAAEPAHSGARGYLTDTREGLAYVRTNATARGVIGLVVVIVVFAAMDRPALVVLAEETLDGGSAGYGAVVAALGLGLIAGSTWSVRWGRHLSQTRLLSGAAVMQGAGHLATGLAPHLSVAAMTMAVAGAGNGIENVASDTLLQRGVDRSRLGRVFGVFLGALFLADAVGSAAGGLLVAQTSARTTFMIGGGGMLLTLFVMARVLKAATPPT